MSQLNLISEKLKRQPLGLKRIPEQITNTLVDYSRDHFTIDLGRFNLKLGRRTLIMGILNLTPDSFSGDGIYKLKSQKSKVKIVEEALRIANCMVKDGADIIDVGGQSSRPGSKAVSKNEELDRTIPVIKKLARRIKLPLSIDTYRAEVARQALDNGASLVNDISALHYDKDMARVVGRFRAGLILMHMKGMPLTMQRNPHYTNLMQEIIQYLKNAIRCALDYGVNLEKIIVDPGIGFGKSVEHNLQILRELKQLKVLERPILIGTSRKSFIGKILNTPTHQRTMGTATSCVCAVMNGAHIVRVHDIKEIHQTLKIADKIIHLN